jgi:flavin reductase (DIM6/NTAB) family NADH-FMN oxidoreductase RutF
VTDPRTVELVDVAPGSGELDRARLKSVFGRFPTGVTAVCVDEAGTPVGFSASSFNTVSVDPPLVSLCVQSGSTTWPRIQRTNRIGVSVFSARQAALCRRMSSRRGDRFEGASWFSGTSGALFLNDAAAWLETSIEFEQTVGDHEVVVLRVHRVAFDPEADPLVFGDSRFLGLKPIPGVLRPGEDPAVRAVQDAVHLGWW